MEIAAADPTLAEGTEPPAEEVRARLRQALMYLLEARPGKRVTALSAVWRAATGAEDLHDWRVTCAARHAKVLPGNIRTQLRVTLTGLMHQEPIPSDRALFERTIDRLIAVEAAIARPEDKKKKRRRK